MKTKYSNKKLGIALACLGLGFTLTQSSCTKDFEKYNTNKYNATDSLLKIDGEGLGSFIIPMQLGVFNSTNYNYQVQQNLNADIWSGFMMSGDPFKGGNNNTNYGLASSSDWNHAAFDLAYPSIMSNWLQVKIRAEKTTPDYFAIATILKVEGMHRLTDIYGPIPYSQFGKNALTTPYDSQQSVYTQMFADLDGAIKALTAYVKANPSATPFKPYDLIYNGDYKEWLKFANSLRLRLAIRISLVDPATAQTQGNAALTDPNGLMTTNADNAFVKASNGVTFTNPLWSICYEYTDINMGAPMECYLKGFKDPRIDAWFVKNSAGDYRGIRQGVAIQSTSDYADASRFNMTNTSPIKFMTSSEVAFLCAEAALKGWNVAGSAQTWYEKGIQLSFDQAGVPIGSYLSDATSTEAPYTDLAKASNNVTAGSPNLSTITIKWNDGDSNDRKLERILTQKWLALWPDGQEAWSEYRRTGYPVLMPVVINNSGGTVNSQIEVRRLPFPINEFTNNKAEVTKALSLLNGPDTGGTPLWWDVNPAHKF